MSIEAEEVGNVTPNALDSITAPNATAAAPTNTLSTAAQASSISINPGTAAANATGWIQNPLTSIENDFKASASNWLMIAFGIVLLIGTVLVSQKSTIVQVAAASA